MKSCNDAIKELVELKDGEISPSRSKSVMNHLAQCEECRQARDNYESSLLALKALLEAEGRAAEGLSISTSVMNEIRMDQSRASRRPIMVKFAAAMIVLLIFAGSAGLVFFRNADSEPSEAITSTPVLIVKVSDGRLDIEDRMEGAVRTVNVRP